MIQWDGTPPDKPPTRRRKEDEPDELDRLTERMQRTDDYLAAAAMLLTMVMIVGAWLLGAGWRP